ncbi:MAG: LemA family protein [Bacteroidetes bacterium]|nr:MAG: LemA family protein [Bacteroidota bacterium]
MKKGTIILLVVLAILVGVGIAIYSMFASAYNGAVERDVAVNQQWANVENVYQRRMDLIPNLIATVKGAADFEKSTLTSVIEARAKATQVTLKAGEGSAPTEADKQAFIQAQSELSSSLSRLLVSVERYPQLQATQQFRDLMVQLEGSENRISVERRKYNATVGEYNVFVRRFPNNILMGMFGFSPRTEFKAEAGAEKAPKVEF